jgi:hypothetical protein
MAIKEELIVEARAETTDAEQGLARVAKAAQSLEEAQKGVAEASAEAGEGLDSASVSAKKAEELFSNGAGAAEEFAAAAAQVGKEAASAKTPILGVGASASSAAGKMSGAAVEGKKFSDMLREVAADADTAAGNVVSGIGGGGFIKALGGAGIAFAGVQKGAEMFLGSSEKLFRSYGPEGMKVWEGVETQMNAIQGEFAAAVLGGNDLNENAKRMNLLLGGTKTVVESLFSPIRLFTEGLWTLVDGSVALSDQQKINIEMEGKYAAAMYASAAAAREEDKSYKELLETLGDVVKSKQQSAAESYQAGLASIDAQLMNNDEARQFRANAAADLAASRALATETEAGIQHKMFQAMQDVKSPESSRRVAMMSYRERAIELLNADASFQAQVRVSSNAARAQAYQDAAALTEEEKQKNNDLLTIRENYAQKAAELAYLAANPPTSTPVTTPRTGGPKPVTDELLYVQEISEGYAKITKEQYEAGLKAQEMTGDFSVEYLEMRQSEFDKIEDMTWDLSTVEAENLGFRLEEERKAAEAIAAAKAAIEEAARQAKKDAEEKLAKDIAKQWKQFGDASEQLGLQNMQDALSAIGTTLGQAAKSGDDFGDALGSTMEALVGQIAGQWGDLFLKQGIGLMFLDPVAGAGLLAAGIGLKALSGFMSGGDSSTDTGTTGASGVQQSAAATTAVARPESSYGYFEGGRSPVTIVTNDAASIRTMQSRLNFVAARGGSGV